MTKARAGERIDALTRHNRPIRAEIDILARAFAPRQNALPAPPLAIDAAPFVCLIVNASWVSHVLGVLETLDQHDAWTGDEDEKHRARNEIRRLMEMLMTGDACMVDPCCPETNELLLDIKVLNQTIVNNQLTIINQNTTIIDNSETVINQNIENVLQQQINQYNQYQTINQQQHIWNQMFYDGNPQSVAPNIPEQWNGGAGDGALCAAINSYVAQMIYQRTVEVNQDAAALGLVGSATASAIIGAAATYAFITGGMSLVLGAVAALALGAGALAVSAWNDSVNNPEARRKVICCMFDHLKDTDVSEESFKASVNDCDFEVGTHESNIAALIDGANQSTDNYIAFLRMVGQQASGDTENCECGCDEEEFNLVAVNNCTVTRIDATHWHIQQNNIDSSDPARPEARVATFQDEFFRCFKLVDEGEQGQSDSSYRDCSGEEHYQLGGIEGVEGIRMSFRQWSNPLDTIITIGCPEEG